VTGKGEISADILNIRTVRKLINQRRERKKQRKNSKSSSGKNKCLLWATATRGLVALQKHQTQRLLRISGARRDTRPVKYIVQERIT